MNRDQAGLLLLAAASTATAFVPGVTGSPIWTLFALVYFSVVPGHALLSALLPRPGRNSSAPLTSLSPSAGDSLGKWLAISVGLSIVLVPLAGMLVVRTSWGLVTEHVVLVLNGLVVLCTLVSALKTPSAAVSERDIGMSGYLVTRTRSAFSGPRADVSLNVALVLCVVLFVGSLSYAAAQPPREPEHTQFFLPGHSETGASSGYAQYPDEVAPDEPNAVSVAVTNREGRPMNYSVVVAVQTMTESNGSLAVASSTELQRTRLTAASGETVSRDLELVLDETGEDLRLVFLLYRGEAPPRPSVGTAYREVHLWVNATT